MSTLYKWRWAIVLVVLAGAIVLIFWFQPTTTVFVVRHADRAGTTIDDLHVPLGTERANELVHVLGSANINVIYHSNTVRSRKTAEPLAAELMISPLTYPPLDVQWVVADIVGNHRGERVFVVGHSNTVPEIIHTLGGPRDPDLNECVYDNLYVVTRRDFSWWPSKFTRWISVVNLKYGAVTPPCP